MAKESPPPGGRVGHQPVRPCGGTEPSREQSNRKQKTRARRDPETGGGKAAQRRNGTESGVRRWGSEATGVPVADRNRRRREERKSRGKRCPVHGGRPTCGYGGQR